MAVTKESGGRLNAFANEPAIDVISSTTTNQNQIKQFAIITTFALITIIGLYFIMK